MQAEPHGVGRNNFPRPTVVRASASAYPSTVHRDHSFFSGPSSASFLKSQPPLLSALSLPRSRLEGDLRNAIAELEAGAARMEELCRLSAEAAANMQETEHAYSSAMIEEAEAVKAAERAAAAAAREVTGGHKTGAAAASAPQATAAAAEGDDVRPATTLEDTRKSRKLVAETGDPSGTGAALDVVADQKQEKSGVLGAKRSAVNSATSDSKRRRRSRIGAPTSGDASIDTVHGAALTPFTAAAGPPELLPHPVFARREQAVREVEASAANPLAVVETYRHVQALAAKLASYEGKLVAAPSTAPASAAATTMVRTRTCLRHNGCGRRTAHPPSRRRCISLPRFMLVSLRG